MKKLILFIGKGGHFNSVISLLSPNLYDKVSYKKIFLPVDKSNIQKNKNIINDFLKKNKSYKVDVFISIGSNYKRYCIYNFLNKYVRYKFNFPVIISNDAVISKNVKIGPGSVIMPGSIINVNSKLGAQSIVNTNSSIDHDCILGSFTSVAPGVVIGGGVKIDKLTHLGIGASIKHNINIGKNVVVGGGSYINKNCISNHFYFGIPGKKIKKRKFEDDYL